MFSLSSSCGTGSRLRGSSPSTSTKASCMFASHMPGSAHVTGETLSSEPTYLEGKTERPR